MILIRKDMNSNMLICWVTPDCFIDCDIDIISQLSYKGLNIKWILVFGLHNRFNKNDFLSLSERANVEIEVYHLSHRDRSFKNLFDYIKLLHKVSKLSADINYINLSPSSPWSLPFFLGLDKNKTIYAAHQGKVHDGMNHKKLISLVRDAVYYHSRYVNMFSKSQAELFKKRYTKVQVYQFLLALKDCGSATKYIPYNGKVRFLSFGTINYAKHIDLLIEAACQLYEEGFKNFTVKIAGYCGNWSSYEKLVRYPEIFIFDIGLIPNKEIPNLFCNSDYFVQPYRVLSQSGPFKIAMNYSIPLITSNLRGFTDEMVENVTGFIFETENVNSMKEVLKKAINIRLQSDKYEKLKTNMKEYVSRTYSTETISNLYINMFNNVITHDNNV